jgi:hypothetical protein
MPDVTVSQKISTIADACFPGTGRAPINRDKLAKGIGLADLEISRFALVLQILRLLTDRTIGVELLRGPMRAGPIKVT